MLAEGERFTADPPLGAVITAPLVEPRSWSWWTHEVVTTRRRCLSCCRADSSGRSRRAWLATRSPLEPLHPSRRVQLVATAPHEERALVVVVGAASRRHHSSPLLGDRVAPAVGIVQCAAWRARTRTRRHCSSRFGADSSRGVLAERERLVACSPLLLDLVRRRRRSAARHRRMGSLAPLCSAHPLPLVTVATTPGVPLRLHRPRLRV